MSMVAKAATSDAHHRAYRGNGRVYNVLSDHAVAADYTPLRKEGIVVNETHCKKTRMANLTGEQYGGGYSRSSFLRKGVTISRSLLQNGT